MNNERKKSIKNEISELEKIKDCIEEILSDEEWYHDNIVDKKTSKKLENENHDKIRRTIRYGGMVVLFLYLIFILVGTFSSNHSFWSYKLSDFMQDKIEYWLLSLKYRN